MNQETNFEKDFIKSYIDFVLTEGKEPTSVYAFAKNLQSSEQEFYQHFSSFDHLKSTIWKNWLMSTLTQIAEDPNYEGFSAREKVLMFYFAFFENLKANRSYALFYAKEIFSPLKNEIHLHDFKKDFNAYIKNVLKDGEESTEIATRPYISDKYVHVFYPKFMYLLHFWYADTSSNFEKTDALIEKIVNLTFDLISNNAIDSLFDLGKFIIQNQKFRF